MSKPYEESMDGTTYPRSAPGTRHEQICDRLHREMAASVARLAGVQLLPSRDKIQVSRATTICPDLAIFIPATGKMLLAVEVINRDDHRPDTVTKKEVYEQLRVPRLWIVDPRYDNVEIYHSFEFGLQLKGILAGKDILSDRLLPEFSIVIGDLFATQ